MFSTSDPNVFTMARSQNSVASVMSMTGPQLKAASTTVQPKAASMSQRGSPLSTWSTL